MRIYLTLDEEQKSALVKMLKTASKPYLRERASAILQIADGKFGNEVAANLLLQPRRKNTVYGWVERYQELGIKGLEIRPGRGPKPVFSPSARRGTKKGAGIDDKSKPL